MAISTSGRSARSRNPDWVSKSDVASLYRCPYAFWKLDRGDIRPSAIFDEATRRRVELGRSFHRELQGRTIKTGLGALLPSPELVNGSRRIYGVPDALLHADGNQFPVEFKWHQSVQPLDKIELAFYWHILEEHQDTSRLPPQGFVVLRTPSGEPAEPMAVELTDRVLDRTARLVEDVRKARRQGVLPRICRCSACKPGGVLHETVTDAVWQRRGLTLIHGLSGKHAEHLEQIGIDTVDKLAERDWFGVLRALWEEGLTVPQQIERRIEQAKSFTREEPVIIGRLPTMEGPFALVDLEYRPGQFIWIVGVSIVESLDTPDASYHLLWAETEREEAANLRQFIELVDRDDLGVLTWSGTGADLPELRKALSRHGLGDYFGELAGRHIDLYREVTDAVALPLPHMGLKAVASYFGHKRKSAIGGGQHALLEFERYRRSDDPSERVRLKERLLEYNRGDLERLLHVSNALRARGAA